MDTLNLFMQQVFGGHLPVLRLQMDRLLAPIIRQASGCNIQSQKLFSWFFWDLKSQTYHNSEKSVFLWILQREDFVDSKREIINLRLWFDGLTTLSSAEWASTPYSQVSQWHFLGFMEEKIICHCEESATTRLRRRLRRGKSNLWRKIMVWLWIFFQAIACGGFPVMPIFTAGRHLFWSFLPR